MDSMQNFFIIAQSESDFRYLTSDLSHGQIYCFSKKIPAANF
jgi:hypothetical protein